MKIAPFDDYKPLGEMEWSIRAYNCTVGNFLVWVWQIRRMTDRELLHVPNLGKITLAEIRRDIPFEVREGESEWQIPSYEERVRLASLGPGHVISVDWIAVIAGAI